MKYSKEITKKICDGIIALKGRRQSAIDAGICEDTFYTWMKEKAEFSESIKRAEEKERDIRRKDAIDCIGRAIHNDTWTAAAWWLERRHDEFIKREKQELRHEFPTEVKVKIVRPK